MLRLEKRRDKTAARMFPSIENNTFHRSDKENAAILTLVFASPNNRSNFRVNDIQLPHSDVTQPITLTYALICVCLVSVFGGWQRSLRSTA
jgi:hypothetical protein